MGGCVGAGGRVGAGGSVVAGGSVGLNASVFFSPAVQAQISSSTSIAAKITFPFFKKTFIRSLPMLRFPVARM
jgi:hypothetical protein